MALDGVDPFDPTPAQRRQYKPGQGSSVGTAPDRPYLIIGNRTSSGSETVDKISDTPLGDENDAYTRLGGRSEAYWLYKAIRDVDPDGRIFVGCPTESAGIASTFKLSVSNASTAAGTLYLDLLGYSVPVSINNGDTQQTVATAIAKAVNDFLGGYLPVTATSAIDGAGPDYKADITAAQKGPRGDQILGGTATRGIRLRWVGPTQAQTYTKNALTSGTTEDDLTALIGEIEASAAKGNVYYVVTAKSPITGPTTTDQGLGQLVKKLKDLVAATVGIDTEWFACVVDTQANATTVATAAALNDWQGHLIWAKNCDWTSGMVAAHVAAKVRFKQIAYPADNLNEAALDVPKPYANADNPDRTAVKTALNNGYIPLKFYGGAMRMVRFITNQSLGATGNNDYRAREGHIPSVLHLCWSIFSQILTAHAQPNADYDPPDGAIPPALTTTPANIVADHEAFIDEMTANRPLQGKYPGPIFQPSAAAAMKAKFSCTFDGAGGFNLQHDWKSAIHRIKTASEIRETGPSY